MRELVFGLRLFAKAGTALLAHRGAGGDPRAARDALSLAADCFDAIAVMAEEGGGDGGEAAAELPGLLDEGFDVVSTLADAASLVGECEGEGKCGDGKGDGDWRGIVLECLKRAEAFVDRHCDVFQAGVVDDVRSASRLAALQRFLPSLARTCYRVSCSDRSSTISSRRTADQRAVR